MDALITLFNFLNTILNPTDEDVIGQLADADLIAPVKATIELDGGEATGVLVNEDGKILLM